MHTHQFISKCWSLEIWMVADLGGRRRAVGTHRVFITLVLVVSGSTASMEELQDLLMELAARNAELTQRVLAVEAVISTPTPQKVVLPSVIATRLLNQPVAIDGDRTKWAEWAFMFRAYASQMHGRLDGARAECDRPAGRAHSAK